MAVPIDPRAVYMALFDEGYDDVMPQDATGNLVDLVEDSTLTRPASTTVLTGAGHGRVFVASSTTGLEAEDTDDDLQLTGDMSIVLIASLDVTAQDTAGTGTIVWRGRDTEETPFGLRLTVIDDATDRVKLQMVWEDSSGTEVADGGVQFTWNDGEEYLIAAIREKDDDAFTIRYVINRQAYTSTSAPAYDVGAASGSSLFVGCEPSGASAYTNHFDGTLYYLAIFDEAVAVEEVFKTWDLLNEDGPRAVTALRGHLPPGPYDKADKDTSAIFAEIDIEASQHALFRNDLRDLSHFFMPGNAFGSRLEEWEAIAKKKPFPTDSIDTRQARLEQHFQRNDGYDLEGLRYQLAELLGYDADPTLLDLQTHSTTRTEDFSSAPTDVIITQGNGTIAVAAGVLDLDIAASSALFAGSFDDIPSHVWPLTASRDTFFGGKFTRNASPTQDNVFIGFVVGSKQTQDWLFIGIVREASGYSVMHARWTRSGGWSGFPTVLENPFNNADVYFRIRHKGDGAYDVQWGTSDANAQAQTPTEISGPSDPLWAGVCLASDVSNNVTADYSFDDWYTHEVEGVAPVTYYLYRDPADANEYDVEGAHARLQEIGPVHFEGYVIDELALECDDTDTGCDRQPMGS